MSGIILPCGTNDRHGPARLLGRGALLLTLVATLLAVQPVRADTITVCASGCDYTTIQAAIDAAAAGTTITVMDPVHTEAEIVVDRDVTIQGQGATATVVQARAADDEIRGRVFSILPGATVTVRLMTIRHGRPLGTPESGGGIRNQGTLTLESVIVRDNSAGAGGGILNDGTLTLFNTTVSHNTAIGGSNYMECSTGGGIKNMAGTMTIINSTISDNTAVGKGGGIHLACDGVLMMVNSTVSGNSSEDDGGGIYIDGWGRLIHSTISNNLANNGGGVYLDGNREEGLIRGRLDFTHTIIAGNTIDFMVEYGSADCRIGNYGYIEANVDNWVGDGSCSPTYSGDPLLAPLADSGTTTAYGNPPQGHALLADSAAIDVIPAEECSTAFDQWGVERPQGGGCDLGALELPGGRSGEVSWLLVGGLGGILVVLVAGVLLVLRRRHA